MSSMLRNFKRNQEKKDIEELKTTYGKKPKQRCPRCKQKTIFMKNKDNEVYCVKCDSRIK